MVVEPFVAKIIKIIIKSFFITKLYITFAVNELRHINIKVNSNCLLTFQNINLLNHNLNKF